MRILLPVDEVLFWQDLKRVTDDGCTAVRRWTQPNDLWPKPNRMGVLIVRDVMNRCRDCHDVKWRSRSCRGRRLRLRLRLRRCGNLFGQLCNRIDDRLKHVLVGGLKSDGVGGFFDRRQGFMKTFF